MWMLLGLLVFASAAIPEIFSFSPSEVAQEGGTFFVVDGANFEEHTTISINGVHMYTYLTKSSVSISGFSDPLPTGPGVVTAHTGAVSSVGRLHMVFVNAPPVWLEVIPSFGRLEGGEEVTIKGENFGYEVSTTRITLGDTACEAITWRSSAEFACVVPSASSAAFANGTLQVDASGRQTLHNAYQYLERPAVTSVSPPEGTLLGNFVITVAGTGFGATTHDISVSICNGTTWVDPGTVRCLLLPAAVPGFVPVVVTSSIVGSSIPQFNFTYVPTPVITLVTPAVGPTAGGFIVTISGNTFGTSGDGLEITIGDVVCAVSTWINASSVECTTAGAEFPGLAKVQVFTDTIGFSEPFSHYEFVGDGVVTCTNGRQDGDEWFPDCGGSECTLACHTCASAGTCADNIQNGDETGRDCGGSCSPCPCMGGSGRVEVHRGAGLISLRTAFQECDERCACSTITLASTGTYLWKAAPDGPVLNASAVSPLRVRGSAGAVVQHNHFLSVTRTSRLTIEGVTFRGIDTPMEIGYGAHVTFDRCVFEGSNAPSIFAIRACGHVVLVDCQFRGTSGGPALAVDALGSASGEGTSFVALTHLSGSGVVASAVSTSGSFACSGCTFADSSGAAVAVLPGGHANVTNSTFSGMAAPAGGALHLDGGTATISACTFSNNSGADGTSVYVTGNASGAFHECLFADSPRGSSPDVRVLDGTATFVGCVFANHSLVVGEAEAAGVLEFRDCHFLRNRAGCVRSSGRVLISNSTAIDNVAPGEGGVAACSAGTLLCAASRFVGNRAPYGGVVATSASAEAAFSECVFEHNRGDTEGGVAFLAGAAGSFENCTLRGNTAGRGGGVFLSSGLGAFSGCDFLENSAATLGGAVYGASGHSLRLEGCDITASNATAGGGIYSDGAANVSVVGTVFGANVAVTGGAAFVSFPAAATIRASRLVGNSAFEGAGLALEFGAFEIAGVVAVGNSASSVGGALLVSYGDVSVTACSFDRNEASDGGAIGLSKIGHATLSDSTFTANTAAQSGGALHITLATTLALANVTLEHNLATFGGAIRAHLTNMSMASSALRSNVASADGGAVYALDCPVVFLGTSRLQNNSAGSGGGALALERSVAEVVACTVEGGEAAQGGGVLCAQGSLVGRDLLVAQCSANTGGGMYVRECTAEINNATFRANAATNGAGLAAESLSVGTSQPVSIEASFFVANSATAGGGGLAVQGCRVTVLSTRFENNGAEWGGGLFQGSALSGEASCDAEVRDTCSFTHNVAARGGGVYGEHARASPGATAAFHGNSARLSGPDVATVAEGLRATGDVVAVVSGSKTPLLRVSFYDYFNQTYVLAPAAAATAVVVSSPSTAQLQNVDPLVAGAIITYRPTIYTSTVGVVPVTFTASPSIVTAVATFGVHVAACAGVMELAEGLLFPSCQCPLGTLVSSDGCLLCPPGTFSSAAGQSACAPCSPGTYAAEAGSVACARCPAGTYNASTGASQCLPCPPGEWSVPGSPCSPCPSGTSSNGTACINCPRGLFAGSEGTSICARCAPGRVTRSEGQRECALCNEGSYSTPPGGSGVECLDCPPEARCTRGLASPLPGYWRDPASGAYYACEDENSNACPGADGACGRGHKQGSFLCGECDTESPEGRYEKSGATCTQCGSAARDVFVVIVVVVLWVAFVAYNVTSAGKEIGLPDVLQIIAVSHAQQLAIVLSSTVQQRTVISSALGFSSSASPSPRSHPVNCLLGSSAFTGFTLVLVVAGGTTAVLGVLRSIFALVLKDAKKRDVCTTILTVFHFMAYPTITSTMLGMLNCRADVNRLEDDLAVVCWEGTHTFFGTLAIFGVILCGVGLPFTFAGILYTKRERLSTPQVLGVYRFLFEAYTPACYYYEVTILLRKTAMLAVVVFVTNPAVESSFLGLVLLIAIFNNVVLNPYKYALANNADALSLVLNIATVLTGAMLCAEDITRDSPGVVATMVILSIAHIVFLLFLLARFIWPKIPTSIKVKLGIVEPVDSCSAASSEDDGTDNNVELSSKKKDVVLPILDSSGSESIEVPVLNGAIAADTYPADAND